VLGLTYCALFDAEHSDMAEFAGGIILFERMSQAREPRLSSNVALAALVVGLLSLLLPVGGDAGDTLKALILCVTLYVLCLSILTNPSGWLTRVFMWRPLRWLGNMSYSFYLLHGLAINTLFSVLAKLLPSLNAGVFGSFVLALLALGVSAVGSALLFLLVERPLSLAQGEPRRPPAPSATSLDSSSAS
jgi:peptidoglycan/LPS O-acetylase OafA/YrhL